MDLQWLEQSEADVPADDSWLGPGEVRCLAQMRFPKRRADWRLGRWTAKCAVAVCLDRAGPFADIEIRAAASGAPEVFYQNRPAAVTISISHRAGVACCAATDRMAAVGCDLEFVEPRSRAFVADYFTVEERALIADVALPAQPRALALFWSAKESALKALGVGLRADTRSVSVKCPAVSTLLSSEFGGWCPMTVRHAGNELDGWWHSSGPLVRTLVTVPLLRPRFCSVAMAIHSNPTANKKDDRGSGTGAGAVTTRGLSAVLLK